ncbi:MAG: hypothetical protein OER88_01730, partial [Planctomycetota bacterium]|nr:hypothetical protein [Planctomycetota bacterium]
AEFELPVHEPGGMKLFDATATLDFDANFFDTDTILPVPVQVKGVSETNPFNLGSNGVFPVSILSTADFDAVAEVDLASLSILGAVIDKSTVEDSNGDGLLDVKVHWRTQDLVDAGVNENTTKLFVVGSTKLGMTIAGMDGIRIVPPVN